MDSFEVVQPARISKQNDPYLDIDEGEDKGDEADLNTQELGEYTAKLQENGDACELSDLNSTEDDMPICAEFADDKWDEEFMTELEPASQIVCPADDSDVSRD